MAVTDVGTMTYDGPLPGAGQYGLYAAGVNAAYQSALAQTQNSRSQFATQEGISLGPDGSWGITGNDAGSGAQQMLSQGAQAQMQSDAAQSALGFGGGLAQQQHEATHAAVSQNAANWANSVVGQLGDYNAADSAALSTQGSDLYQGLMNDVTTAIQNGTFNPANYAGINIPGYGDLGTLLAGVPASTPLAGSGTGTSGFTAGGSAGSSGSGKKKGK